MSGVRLLREPGVQQVWWFETTLLEVNVRVKERIRWRARPKKTDGFSYRSVRGNRYEPCLVSTIGGAR